MDPKPIDETLLQKIVKTREEASMGYATVNNQVYSQHVRALLEDREHLLKVNRELAKELEDKEDDK